MEYARERGPAPLYDEFWATVRGQVKGWEVPRRERLSETLEDLTSNLQEKTIKDPNPSYSVQAIHENRRKDYWQG
jgi:hypothetical protein